MSMSDTIRAFIAVEIPEEIKNRFGEIQRRLRASKADVRWVKTANTHVTLQFLGDTPVEKVEAIESALRRVGASHPGFDVSIEGLGVFPNARRPRVIWIGVSRGAEALTKLQSSVSRELKKLGFKTEKRDYSPHITVGRVKSPKGVEELMRLLDAERKFQAGNFRATGIHLIRSVLSSEGPTYTTLFTSELPEV